jgi:hypothetical protein
LKAARPRDIINAMKHLASALILLLFFLSPALCRDFAYIQKTKDITMKLAVKISEEEGVSTITCSDDYYLITNEVKVKKGSGVFEWTFKDPKNASDVKGLREGNVIKLAGKYKDRDFVKEHYIDDRPWHQVFTWDLGDFFASDEKRIEFWAVRPENLESAGVLVAYKDKEEKVDVGGSEVEAVNVKVTLAGLLSIFWTGDYWYRKSDNLYIRAKPSADFLVELGTPPVTGERQGSAQTGAK